MTRNAFGQLVVAPERLTREQRVDVLRRLSGRLQAARDLETNWLGSVLTQWLSAGAGDLLDALGLRPPPGSKRTVQAILRGEQRDRAMLKLSVAAGGDRAALRILAGVAPCPPSARQLLDELCELGTPRSTAAFTRARRRVSRAR